MGNLDTALKRYYRSIRKDLLCSYKMKKRIMQQIRESVDQFLEQNPDAEFDAVRLHFGEPQTIALSYIEDQDAPELLQKMCIKKKVSCNYCCCNVFDSGNLATGHSMGYC